jgi:hypothetical protein
MNEPYADVKPIQGDRDDSELDPPDQGEDDDYFPVPEVLDEP